jgi:(+)-pinoresinol hydroxylase
MRRSHLHRAAIAVVSLLASVGAAHGADAPGNDGRAVYERWCSHCHDPGVQHPGTNALTVKYKGAKSGVIREWKDLTPELVRFWVRNGISVMAPFRKTEIDDAQLAALRRPVKETPQAPRP